MPELARTILIASMLACCGTAAGQGAIAGCANEIPLGFVAVDELRHDDGGGPDYLVTAGVNSGQQVIVVHANRFTSAAGTIITDICIYTENPDPMTPGAQAMELFIANGDDLSHNDTRPGTTVWSSFETIQVGWQLVPVNPPVVAPATTWIGAKFPTATATNAHMGVNTATDYLPDGVTPQPDQAFVGIINLVGGQDVWTDYEDIATGGFQGYRPIIRGLEVDVANCANAGVVVTTFGNLETTEAGGIASFEVSLTGPLPTNNVLVLLSSTDTTEGTPHTIALVFTPATAGLPQLVIVTGQDDPDPDGDVPYSIDLLTSSLDPCYHGIQGPSVGLVNLDDEIAPCPWDCDGNNDGLVGVDDFLAVLAQWGQAGTTCHFGPGPVVGVDEFLDILAHWGGCP